MRALTKKVIRDVIQDRKTSQVLEAYDIAQKSPAKKPDLYSLKCSFELIFKLFIGNSFFSSLCKHRNRNKPHHQHNSDL